MRRTILIPLLVAVAAADETADEKQQADLIARKMASNDDGIRIDGLREAISNQHASLLAPLTRALKDRDPAVRIAAVEALAAREDEAQRKKAASALVGRLKILEKKDEETPSEEIKKVVTALHDLAQPSTIKALLSIPHDSDRGLARDRLMAAANAPSKEAIDRLIQFGSSGSRRQRWRRQMTILALRYATQEQVSGGIDEWRKWWKENRRAFDTEVAAKRRKEAGQPKSGGNPNRGKRGS